MTTTWEPRMVVTIRRGPLSADVSVPSQMPVAELVPLLVERLPGPAEGPDAPPRLCRLDASALDPAAGLAHGGVRDGDILTIEEAAQPADRWGVDDFPQAVRRTVDTTVAPWSVADGTAAAAFALALLVAGLTLVVCRWLTAPWEPVIALAATAGATGIALAGVAAVLAAAGCHRYPLMMLGWSCTGVLLAAAGSVTAALAAAGLTGAGQGAGPPAGGPVAAGVIGLAGAVAVLLAPALPRLAATSCGLERQALREALDPVGPARDPATGLPPDLPDRVRRGHDLLLGWTAATSTVVLAVALTQSPVRPLSMALAALLGASLLVRVTRSPCRAGGWLWLAGGLGSLAVVSLSAGTSPLLDDVLTAGPATAVGAGASTVVAIGLVVALIRRAGGRRTEGSRPSRLLTALDQLIQVAVVPLAVLALR